MIKVHIPYNQAMHGFLLADTSMIVTMSWLPQRELGFIGSRHEWRVAPRLMSARNLDLFVCNGLQARTTDNRQLQPNQTPFS